MAAVVAAAEQQEAAATGWERDKEIWREGAAMQLLQEWHRQVGEEWG
jgi:anthranilate phosphoribosyltransferase